jgi:hypothetical protein
VNDFTAVAGGGAEHMSPEEMRENFPDAWNYAAATPGIAGLP